MNENRPQEETLTTADIAGEQSASRSYEVKQGPGGAAMAREVSSPLLPENEAETLRTRWDSIQTGFVDEPRKAVEEADHLVASAMKRLADMFSEERSRLERQWSRGDNVSTEDLRVALQRYRSFFARLLSV